MRGIRIVVMRKEIPVNGDTLSNGEDEEMLQMMEAKGWVRRWDLTKPSIFVTVKQALQEMLQKEQEGHKTRSERLHEMIAQVFTWH